MKPKKNRIARWLFGQPSERGPEPEVPNLNQPTLSVYHDGNDIQVHWVDSVFINRITFNGIFGSVMAWNSSARQDIF